MGGQSKKRGTYEERVKQSREIAVNKFWQIRKMAYESNDMTCVELMDSMLNESDSNKIDANIKWFNRNYPQSEIIKKEEKDAVN